MEKNRMVVNNADYQLDEVLGKLGGFKRYQIFYCLMVSLPIILQACHVTSFVFTVSVPEYRCSVPECETGDFDPTWLNFTIPQKDDGTFDSCTRYAPVNYSNNKDNSIFLKNNDCTPTSFDPNIILDCKTWQYNDMNSIIGEYDLGCELWKHTFVGTMNSVGALFGTFIGGVICDMYGRKLVLIAGMFLSGVCGLARIFAPDYWTFVTLEFLNGLVVAGVFNVSVIMCVEIVDPRYRVLATMFSCYTFALGEFFLGTVAWAFPYWKTTLAILYFPSLLFIFYIWFIPESMKWLLSEHKVEEISRVINTVAKANKIELCQNELKEFYDTIERNQINSELQQTESSQHILVQMLKSRVLLLRLIFCSLWFLVANFVYFGLTLNPAILSGNVYLNFILVSLVEVPGYTVYYFVVEWYGRKVPMMVSYIMAGLPCIAFIYVPEGMMWLNILLFMTGKFFITIAFTVVFIYAAELFPTFMRGSAIGICSFFGGVGLILAPQIPLLSSYMESLPFILFGGSSILCGVTSLIFPDTSKVKLPDTVEEAENIGKLPR